ncbi:MAG: DUF3090 domain-containing protein [Chloroflexi bacterium]|nr:DUF3090 domain-containing protein [Chloroflexota bacterium]
MPRIEIDLSPVAYISTDAIGSPGKRIFYLQGQKGARTVTLLLEKFQVESLAIGIEQFLAEVARKFPELPEASAVYDENAMRIHPPLDPLFRLSDIGLGYDADNDMIVLIAHELLPADTDEEPGVVRFWCTRYQLRILSRWGIEVVSRGRPICPQCGQPMDPEGHFCTKKNGGHRRSADR